MSDQPIQQGFLGPRAAVEQARALLAAHPSVGGVYPPLGQAPQRVLKGSDALWSFGIVTRERLAPPDGVDETEDAVAVAAMGATF